MSKKKSKTSFKIPKKKSKSPKEKTKPPKISKSQLRKISELREFYRKINELSLREEAYTVALQHYIHLKKK